MRFDLVFGVSLTVASLTLSVPIAVSASQTSPAFAKAQSKGQALMERGKYQAAIKHLKKAEELAGEPPARLLLDLALCFNNIGELADSEAYARRGLKASEDAVDRARAYNRLGISLFSLVQLHFNIMKVPKQGGHRSANNGADRQDSAHRSRPGRSLPEVLEEAESAFREILELTDGQASIAWYNLGEVLKLQGRRPEADNAFAEYLELSPDGAYAAAARRALNWMACVQAISGPESSGDDSSEGVPPAPYQVGGDVLPPVKIHASQPSYNARARSAGIQGAIILEAIIDQNGDVQCLDVVKGLPMGLSEDAARAVSGWKYEPATLHGEPVVVKFYVMLKMSIG